MHCVTGESGQGSRWTPAVVAVILAAVIGAIATIVAAAIMRNGGSEVRPPPSTTTERVPPSLPPLRPRAEITSPANDAAVSAGAGFTAQGTSANLGTRTLWLLDQDPDGTYTVDSPARWVQLESGTLRMRRWETPVTCHSISPWFLLSPIMTALMRSARSWRQRTAHSAGCCIIVDQVRVYANRQ